MAKLTFHQGPGRRDGVILLDGEDISPAVCSVSIKADAGEIPEVSLQLAVIEIEVEIPGRENEIRVTQATADLLKRFGWAPPPSGFVVAKASTAEEI